MKKKLLSGFAVGVMMLGMAGVASATLTTIGQASYNGGNYNLIWDNDNNGNSVVWLDYTNASTDWTSQNTWATGLNTAGVLDYTLNTGYSVNWGTNDWRLPNTVDGAVKYGYDGSTTAGFNIITSEMGHLFYTELKNKGSISETGISPQAGWGLTSTEDFVHLTPSWYWSGTSGTEDASLAWGFSMCDGNQYGFLKEGNEYGLAVRSGQVTAPVPEPATMLLMGTGLAGLIGARRKKKA